MNLYSSLKEAWKKLGIKGQVKNYSALPLWVIETDTQDKPIARILSSGYKTPKDIDVDGFKRADGKAIQRHKSWWKFYDFSTVDISEDNRGLKVSVVSKTAVKENHFGKVTYVQEEFGEPIVAVTDVKRDKKKKIISYYVTGHGWLDVETVFKMTCYHEIDNARPVFPKGGRPYIRTKRDEYLINNLDQKGNS